MSLKYFFTQPDLNAWQARWLSFLSEFDMEIKHIQGNENKVVDYFSRNSHQILNNVGSSVKFDIEELIQEMMMQDSNYVNLKLKLQKTEIVGYTQNQKGLIYCNKRLYIPKCDIIRKWNFRWVS